MMNYIVGAGAVLTAGRGEITAATLHAQTEPAIAASVRAAIVDFEAGSSRELSRLVLVLAGWNAGRVRAELVEPLMAHGECDLVDLMRLLGLAGGGEVHLFARWLPDDILTAGLARSGVTLVAHPLESIRQAALVCGQHYGRWPNPLRAA
jgi:hypothetical protein